MDRERLVDRMDTKAAPEPEKPSVGKRAVRSAAKATPALWLRSIGDYRTPRQRAQRTVPRFG